MRQLDNLPIDAGGGWCQAVIMVPSQNEATILATRRLYSPLKFCLPRRCCFFAPDGCMTSQDRLYHLYLLQDQDSLFAFIGREMA